MCSRKLSSRSVRLTRENAGDGRLDTTSSSPLSSSSPRHHNTTSNMEIDSNVHCITQGPKDGEENRPYDGNRNNRRNNDEAVIVRRRVRERFRQKHGKATTNRNGEVRTSYHPNPHQKDNSAKISSFKSKLTRLQYYRHQHRLVMLELKIDALRRRSSTIDRRRIRHHQATSRYEASRVTLSPPPPPPPPSSSSKEASESTLQESSSRPLSSNREIVPVSHKRGSRTTTLHSKNSVEHASLFGNGEDVEEDKHSDSTTSVFHRVALPSHELDLEKSSDVLSNHNGDYINVDALAIANARRSIEEARMFLAARKLMKYSKKDETLNTDCVPNPVDQSETHQSQDSDTREMRATSFPFAHSEEDHGSNQEFVQFELSFPLDEHPVAASQSGEQKTETMKGNKDSTVDDDSCKGTDSSPSKTETRNALADVTLDDEYKRNHYHGINKLFSCSSSSSSRKERAPRRKTLDKLDPRRNESSTHSSSRGNTVEGSDQLTNSTSQDAGSDYGRGYRKIKSIDIQRKRGTSTATKWYIRQDVDEQKAPGLKPAVRRSSFFGRKNLSRSIAATAQDPAESEGVVMDMVFFDVVHPHNSDLEVVPEDQSLLDGQESFGFHEG